MKNVWLQRRNNKLPPHIYGFKTPEKHLLKMAWTFEASQDLRAMHNLNAEAILGEMLAHEIVAAIDQEVLNARSVTT